MVAQVVDALTQPDRLRLGVACQLRAGPRQAEGGDHQRGERKRAGVDEERQPDRDGEEHRAHRKADQVAHRVLGCEQHAVRASEELRRALVAHDGARGHVEEQRTHPDAHRHDVGEQDAADAEEEEHTGDEDDDEAAEVHREQQASPVDAVDGRRADHAEDERRDVICREHRGDGDGVRRRGRGEETDRRQGDAVADARHRVRPPEAMEILTQAGTGLARARIAGSGASRIGAGRIGAGRIGARARTGRLCAPKPGHHGVPSAQREAIWPPIACLRTRPVATIRRRRRTRGRRRPARGRRRHPASGRSRRRYRRRRA